MTLANGKAKQLIQQRARALAIMYLTRYEDLEIEEPRADFGLDLRAEGPWRGFASLDSTSIGAELARYPIRSDR